MHSERLHYMDNLRAIIMIAGVFFHAALAYSPFLHAVWMSADTINSPIMDWFIHFSHAFRMPLFFLLAGFFAALLIERRGSGGLLKNRALRVLLPFIIFWPIIQAGIIVPLMWAVNHIENLPPLLQFIAAMQNNPDAPKMPPSTGHLWFLYYLMFFYVLLCVIREFNFTWLAKLIAGLPPIVALIVLPLLLVPGLWLTQLPHPAPDSFMPQPWAFIFYGLFFAYGYGLFKHPGMLEKIGRYWPALLVISAVLNSLFFYWLPGPASFQGLALEWPMRLALTLCLAYTAVYMSIACLALAKKWLTTHNRVMRYFADASYWIYIAHLPIVLAIQYWLLDQPGNIAYKYTLSVAGTLVICILSYALLVRPTPVGWLLNGRKKHSLAPTRSEEVEVTSNPL